MTSAREKYTGSVSTTDGEVVIGACDIGIEYNVSKINGFPSLYDWHGVLHTEQSVLGLVAGIRPLILDTQHGRGTIQATRVDMSGQGWRLEFMGRLIPPMTMRIKKWLKDRGFCE